jgi:hypothetical protein
MPNIFAGQSMRKLALFFLLLAALTSAYYVVLAIPASAQGSPTLEQANRCVDPWEASLPKCVELKAKCEKLGGTFHAAAVDMVSMRFYCLDPKTGKPMALGTPEISCR